MKEVLIDTNVVSILFKQDHPLRKTCMDEIDGRQCYLSFMTRAELLLWPRANAWGAARHSRLSQHIGQFTTLYADEDTCTVWASIMAESRRLGRPITTADAWIAATAKQWNLPLVTANYRDFDHLTGLILIPI
jgi:predicted nucleic acid-binding protein